MFNVIEKHPRNKMCIAMLLSQALVPGQVLQKSGFSEKAMISQLFRFNMHVDLYLI